MSTSELVSSRKGVSSSLPTAMMTASIRRLGSDKQTVMGLEEAIAALVDEAVAPDVRRGREGQA